MFIFWQDASSIKLCQIISKEIFMTIVLQFFYKDNRSDSRYKSQRKNQARSKIREQNLQIKRGSTDLINVSQEAREQKTNQNDWQPFWHRHR